MHCAIIVTPIHDSCFILHFTRRRVATGRIKYYPTYDVDTVHLANGLFENDMPAINDSRPQTLGGFLRKHSNTALSWVD
jgi:hypothetical protein